MENAPRKAYPVAPQQVTQHKSSFEGCLDDLDKRIMMLEALHYDIGARLGKAKIKHLHTYDYADIVPLEVDHTLIPSQPIR